VQASYHNSRVQSPIDIKTVLRLRSIYFWSLTNNLYIIWVYLYRPFHFKRLRCVSMVVLLADLHCRWNRARYRMCR